MDFYIGRVKVSDAESVSDSIRRDIAEKNMSLVRVLKLGIVTLPGWVEYVAEVRAAEELGEEAG